MCSQGPYEDLIVTSGFASSSITRASMSPLYAAIIKGVHTEPIAFIHGSLFETFLIKVEDFSQTVTRPSLAHVERALMSAPA